MWCYITVIPVYNILNMFIVYFSLALFGLRLYTYTNNNIPNPIKYKTPFRFGLYCYKRFNYDVEVIYCLCYYSIRCYRLWWRRVRKNSNAEFSRLWANTILVQATQSSFKSIINVDHVSNFQLHCNTKL